MNDWTNCKRCILHKTRKNVVLNRRIPGEPPDVLLLGEAPGHAEDTDGLPFVGPSGRLLRKALAHVPEPRSGFFITNTVACIPLVESGKIMTPPACALAACRPRLESLAETRVFRAVVFLGRVAERAGRKLWPKGRYAPHPAYVLRTGGVGSTPWYALVRELKEAAKCASR